VKTLPVGLDGLQTTIALGFDSKARHVDRLRPGEDRVGGVVLVERREHHHPVARIAGGHHGHHHRLGAAAGDHQVAVRIDLQAGVAGDLAGKGAAEARGAPGHCVLVEWSAGRLFQRGKERLGRVEVREPLAQVDRPDFLRQGRHDGEDGGAYLGQAALDGGSQNGIHGVSGGQ
jgi:hypothetical protein